MCAPDRATPGTPASTIFKLLLKFIIGYNSLIVNIGIISVKAYSLYCHPGTNLTLFKHVRIYHGNLDNDVINMAPYLYLSE